MDKIQQFNQKYNTREIPEIQPGWTIKIFQKIKEGGKERVAPFEGIVIAKKHGKEVGGTFTVRKIISGVGVEKIFPIHSPTIEKIEIVKKAKVRRAKLYYLREKSRKETRRKLKAI
ncbi:MAG: large subunit ribosomal protein L19 [Parcubacteria group bacterium Gr01-1014_2]|nr:MAG: large subunit ribosomal protein L19 [Parcubacteria group bacterium Gr01-1014_2]